MGQKDIISIQEEAIRLLKDLIGLPSFSRQEEQTADALQAFMESSGLQPQRYLNNVWSVNKNFSPGKYTVLLNSHHDTVRPATGYTRDPFAATEEEGKLYGLGSNDAGGCLVSLLACFRWFYEQELPFNLVFAATAEEEISGQNGVEALLPRLPPIDVGIVGEPTKMQMAVAEKGLLVIDVQVEGRAGHAARNEGENAIYKAMRDIEWFESYRPPKVSRWLGPVNMAVTSIETKNKAHNVVPDKCCFTVDVRLNELYSHAEMLALIQENIHGKATARSTRLKAGFISEDHPLVRAGLALQRGLYGSPTCSDMALMPFETVKMGPGDSARSHTPDEYIHLNEIKEGISLYIALLEGLEKSLK